MKVIDVDSPQMYNAVSCLLQGDRNWSKFVMPRKTEKETKQQTMIEQPGQPVVEEVQQEVQQEIQQEVQEEVQQEVQQVEQPGQPASEEVINIDEQEKNINLILEESKKEGEKIAEEDKKEDKKEKLSAEKNAEDKKEHLMQPRRLPLKLAARDLSVPRRSSIDGDLKQTQNYLGTYSTSYSLTYIYQACL
jgi:hypothetical protein